MSLLDIGITTKEEVKRYFNLISEVVDKASNMGIVANSSNPKMTLSMDIENAKLNSEDLLALLAFHNEDFIHDIIGIQRHMNRETCRLENFFVPRCVDSHRAL